MRSELFEILKTIDLENCSGVHLTLFGGGFLIDDSEAPIGIDLECIETCTLDGAVDYLEGCF